MLYSRPPPGGALLEANPQRRYRRRQSMASTVAVARIDDYFIWSQRIRLHHRIAAVRAMVTGLAASLAGETRCVIEFSPMVVIAARIT